MMSRSWSFRGVEGGGSSDLGGALRRGVSSRVLAPPDLFYTTIRAGAREKASRQSKKKLLLASQCKRRKGEVHGSPAVEAKEVAPAF